MKPFLKSFSQSLSFPISGQSASPTFRPKGSFSSASKGRLITDTFSSFAIMRPAKSSSCHLVIINMTFECDWKRDLNEFCHSSHILSLVVSESASSLFLIGSSIIIRSADLPVTPDNTPRLIIPPVVPLSSKSRFVFGSPICIPNMSFPNSSIFCLFLRPNLLAKSSEYDISITLLLGFLPRYHDGRVSVIVILL